MRALESYHPAVVAVATAAWIGFLMLYTDPILTLLSLVGAASYLVLRGDGRRRHLWLIALFFVMTLINPFFSHNGATVLFFFNQKPVTLEAILWGASSAATVVTVLVWLLVFAQIMTSDRLLCLFGALSPRLALTLSMSLRYVPRFSRQMRRVNAAQTAMGLYRDDHVVCRIRGGARVFSVMLTWALENGIVTADSMAARGYGIGRRTYFTVLRFRRADAILLTVILALSALVGAVALTGRFDTVYYPTLSMGATDAWSVVGYAAYGLLCWMPAMLKIWEVCRWKFLRSKI